MSRGSWPVRVTSPDGAVSGAVVWKKQGKLGVTILVKATYAWVQGGAMTLADPVEIQLSERFLAHNPMRTLLASSDLAPYLTQADIVLVGHACPKNGERVTEMTVRLALFREDTCLLDKRLAVLGDRVQQAGQEPAAPNGFVRMPITYERALGGMGYAENLLGVGISPEEDGSLILPNITYLDDSKKGVVAGFGPLSKVWPVRSYLLPKGGQTALDQRIPEIIEGVPDEYFQVAPVDQRIEFLRGDEWVVLEGFHPTYMPYRSRLPGVKAVARAYLPGHEPLDVLLQADTLLVDADAERVLITWRGCFPVADEEMLRNVRVLTQLTSLDKDVIWPDLPSADEVTPPSEVMEAAFQPIAGGTGTVVMSESQGSGPAAVAEASKRAEGFKRPGPTVLIGTRALNEEEQERAQEKPNVPFAPVETNREKGEERGRDPGPIPGAPWAHKSPVTPVVKASVGDATVAVDLAPALDTTLAAAEDEPGLKQTSDPLPFVMRPSEQVDKVGREPISAGQAAAGQVMAETSVKAAPTMSRPLATRSRPKVQDILYRSFKKRWK